MGLHDDSFCQIQGHDQDAVPFDGTRKNLDAVCAVVDLLAHSLYRLGVRFDFGDADVVVLKKSLHVNRRSPFHPKWLAGRENPGPFHFAVFNATPDENYWWRGQNAFSEKQIGELLRFVLGTG